MEPGSVTRHIPRLRAGDPEAVRQVWDRFFGPMVDLARRRLMGLPGWDADGEDVALSAFKSFCLAVGEDRFPRLADRNDLWQVLVVVLQRKACDHVRKARRPIHGGDKIHIAADEALADPGPTPEEEARLADEVRGLLDELGDDALRQVALLRLADYTNKEIAERLGCGLRTVERKLERIRRTWEERSPQ
jgi:RNA polymerase sigma factor (sigma-70 family)